MTQKKENKPKRRTQVKDLPKDEKELTKEEQKKVKGGNLKIEGFSRDGDTSGRPKFDDITVS